MIGKEVLRERMWQFADAPEAECKNDPQRKDWTTPDRYRRSTPL